MFAFMYHCLIIQSDKQAQQTKLALVASGSTIPVRGTRMVRPVHPSITPTPRGRRIYSPTLHTPA